MKTIIQTFLFGFSFVIILALCEIFIRSAYIENVSSTELYDDIGRGRRKNLKYLYFNEGFGIGKFNEYRYIGEANPPEKPKNTVRIALMGDSYIESFQVFERNYFGNITENILKKKYPDRLFELLNFGRSGFDIADIYAYQNTLVGQFNPDYFLYIISKNDLEPKYSDPLRPKTILEKGRLTISFNFDSSKIRKYEKSKFFIQNFSLFSMLNNGRKKINETPILSIFLDKIYIWFISDSDEIGHFQKLEYKINPVTAKIVETLDPKKVIFVNRDNSDLPMEFQKLCAEKGFLFIDLSETLNSLKEAGLDPYEWKITGKLGHWNNNAHNAIAIKIAEEINGLIENN